MAGLLDRKCLVGTGAGYRRTHRSRSQRNGTQRQRLQGKPSVGVGRSRLERGSFREARSYQEQRFRLEQEFGIKGAMAYVSCALARITLELGQIVEVRSAPERSLALGRELNYAPFIAWSLLFGRAKLVDGDADGSSSLPEESLVRSRELDARGMGRPRYRQA